MSKGQVAIHNRQGMLILRWRYQGRRFHHSLGIPDNRLNRGIAETLTRRIEADIITGDFDETLNKYLLPHQQRSPRKNLFEAFLARPLKPQTMGLYRAVMTRYRGRYGERLITTPGQAEEFLRWISPQVKESTARAYLIRLNAVWQWGMSEKLVTSNPWLGVVELVKVPPPQPRPFTQAEVEKILTEIVGHFYEDFIKFLLFSGCRIGEAINLTWDCISDDCSQVLIHASKTNSTRRIGLSSPLQAMLLNRRPAAGQNPLVFTNYSGRRVKMNNFINRTWKSILESAGVEYRKPSNSRHTFVTHALAEGVEPLKLSRLTGHSPRVMFQHYYAAIGEVKLPDLFIGAGKGEK